MFNGITGVIVLINCFEMVYIRVAIDITSTFPFVRIRPRITGQARLSMLWQKFNCHALKRPEFNDFGIPRKFYADLKHKNKRRI